MTQWEAPAGEWNFAAPGLRRGKRRWLRPTLYFFLPPAFPSEAETPVPSVNDAMLPYRERVGVT